jgi:hypothetical protein
VDSGYFLVVAEFRINKFQFWLLSLWAYPLTNPISDTGWDTEQEKKNKQCDGEVGG